LLTTDGNQRHPSARSERLPSASRCRLRRDRRRLLRYGHPERLLSSKRANPLFEPTHGRVEAHVMANNGQDKLLYRGVGRNIARKHN
jgi:hypothetical protein